MPTRHYVSAYNGPDTERTIQDCEDEWKKGNLGSIDSLVEEQLHFSITTTVLDIGCGRDAKLLNAFFSDGAISVRSRGLLKQNPQSSIKLVGLTDAEAKEAFGKPISLDKKSNTANITFEHIAYTLTAGQALRDFLPITNIKSLNLVLATWSMAYLTPNVFRELINTVIDNLSIGGRFIAVGYAEDVSGMGFKYHPDIDLLHIDIVNSKLPRNLWEQMLIASALSETILAEKDFFGTEITSYMRRLLSNRRMSYLMDSKERQKLLDQVNQMLSIEELIAIAHLFKEPMRLLWEYQFQKVIKPKKDALIKQLKKDKSLMVETYMGKLLSIQRIAEKSMKASN